MNKYKKENIIIMIPEEALSADENTKWKLGNVVFV